MKVGQLQNFQFVRAGNVNFGIAVLGVFRRFDSLRSGSVDNEIGNVPFGRPQARKPCDGY